MKLLLSIVIVFALGCPVVFAQYDSCTEWTKSIKSSCVFNSSSAIIWVRQCFHKLDKSEVCLPKDVDPNSLERKCTKWYETTDECHDGNSFVQKWIRSCTDVLFKTEFCSDTVNPNFLN